MELLGGHELPPLLRLIRRGLPPSATSALTRAMCTAPREHASVEAAASLRPITVGYCLVTRKLAVPLAARNLSCTVQVPGTPVVVAKVPFSPSER